MSTDRIDKVLEDWGAERPELSTDHLGIVLRIQTLEKLIAERLTVELSKIDLEWFEYDVLSLLRRKGEPFQAIASEIAEGTMLSAGALTNRIDRLMARNLVTRVEDPGDRRCVLISLTEDGAKLADEAAEARFRCAQSAVDVLSDKQGAQLNSLLKKMLVSLDVE